MSAEGQVKIAKALGVRTKTDPGLALAQRLAGGLRVEALDRIAEEVAPGEKGFAATIVPRATLARQRKAGKLSPEASDRVYDLTRVWVTVMRVYRDKEKARRFLNRPHAMLDGATPLKMTQTSSAGADLVIDIIERAEAGVAA